MQIPPCSVFSCNRIAREKSTIKGKNGYTKTRTVDFPRGKSHISGGKFYYIFIFPLGNSTMEKNYSHIFSGGILIGGKDTL